MLLFIDNIFRFVQAGSEVSALLGRMPSAVGYQPTLATEMGQLQERITSTQQGLGHVGAGDLRARRRPHRPGAGEHVRPPRRDHHALAADLGEGHLPGGRPARLDVARPAAGRRLATSTTTPRRACRRCCSATRTCRTSSPSSASTSSPTRTSVVVQRARKIERFLSQPFFVAETFTGQPGKYVQLEDTIARLRARSSTASTTTCPSRPSTWSARSTEAVAKGSRRRGRAGGGGRRRRRGQGRKSPRPFQPKCTSQQCTGRRTSARQDAFECLPRDARGRGVRGRGRDAGRARRRRRDRRARAARAARRDAEGGLDPDLPRPRDSEDIIEFATGPGFFKVEQDRALALVGRRGRRAPDRRGARTGSSSRTAAAPSSERAASGESDADRWQLEQRIQLRERTS